MPRRPLLAAAAMLALSCGGGEGEKRLGLTIDPPVVELTYDLQGGFPAPVELRFTVTDPAAAILGLASGPTSPHFSTGDFYGSWPNYTMLVALNPASQNLPLGTYTDTLRFGLARADQSVIGLVEVPVRLVRANPFSIDSLDRTLDYDVFQGLASEALLAVNGLDHPWESASGPPWVTLDVTSGVSPSVIRARIDGAALAQGPHDATLTFRHTQTGQTAAVTLHVTVQPPVVVLEPAIVTLTGQAGQPVAPFQVSARLSMDQPATYTAVSINCPWLLISPASGTLPATLNLSVDPASGPQQPGTHSGCFWQVTPSMGVSLGGAATLVLAP